MRSSGGRGPPRRRPSTEGAAHLLGNAVLLQLMVSEETGRNAYAWIASEPSLRFLHNLKKRHLAKRKRQPLNKY